MQIRSSIVRIVRAAVSQPLAVTSLMACFSDPAVRPDASQSGSSEGGIQPSHLPRGCATPGGATPRMAPNGYYTNGATVCSSSQEAHLFRGVARPSLEWTPSGEMISPGDFAAMAAWNANVVRIALNQDFWLPSATLFDANYQTNVQQYVLWAESAGLDVILDLHWSDRGDLTVSKSGQLTKQDSNGGSNQQQMADVNSVEFWKEVATTFKGDGRVLFELYNEPNAISWDVWYGGGMAAGFQVAGMQQLYDAVRGAGADNVVIMGGLNYAFDLSRASDFAITGGYNVMYATHPYDKSDNAAGLWQSHFGYLADDNIAPVIMTEFGDPRTACAGDWDSQLIAYADQHEISFTAWAWYPAGCAFPALLSDWAYTPTAQGQVVKDALSRYPKYTPLANDAGADGAGPVDAAVNGSETTAADASQADATLDDASNAEGGTVSSDAAIE